MKRKSLPDACLAVVAATLLLCADHLEAQSPLATKWDESSVRLPAPVEPATPEIRVPAATRATVASPRPVATFTFGDGKKITSRTPTSRFRLVSVHPGEIVDIDLQLSVVLPGNPATAQSLDGGKLISFSQSALGVGALVSIRFQAGNQPGLYRVVVPGLGEPLLLQFWVPDSRNPKANPPVLNPAH